MSSQVGDASNALLHAFTDSVAPVGTVSTPLTTIFFAAMDVSIGFFNVNLIRSSVFVNVYVGITGRNEEHLKSTVAELEKLGVKAAYSVFDVEEMAQVEQGVASIASQLGGIDILINNAGVGDFGSFEDMPVETWEKVMKVNLFGVYYVAKATLPYIKQNKEGDIVNVASTAGLKGGPNMSAYCASKAAVTSLSQSLMAELRKFNIRVITLTPSTIATDMSIEGVS